MKSDRIRPTLVPQNPVSKSVPKFNPNSAFRALPEVVSPIQVDRVLDRFRRIVADPIELSPLRRQSGTEFVSDWIRQHLPDLDRKVLVRHFGVQLLQRHFELIG